MTPEELFIYVQASYANAKPIAITRYGDGEAMVLNGFNDVPAVEYVFKRQLGHSPTIEQVNEIRNNLIEAYDYSDLIGIKQNIRDGLGKYWVTGKDILIQNVPTLLEHHFTSIDFHTDWLVQGKFGQLLHGVDRLFYISCRVLDNDLKEAFEIGSVESYTIAPEMKFTSGYDGPQHYPDQFKHIYRWIQNIDCNGAICLVGAGVIGKIYTKWFKERGGIAIDIGSVFDLWAGKSTRGSGKGMDVEDKTYMLCKK